AAVSLVLSKISPLAVSRPWCGSPYQDAVLVHCAPRSDGGGEGGRTTPDVAHPVASTATSQSPCPRLCADAPIDPAQQTPRPTQRSHDFETQAIDRTRQEPGRTRKRSLRNAPKYRLGEGLPPGATARLNNSFATRLEQSWCQ